MTQPKPINDAILMVLADGKPRSLQDLCSTLQKARPQLKEMYLLNTLKRLQRAGMVMGDASQKNWWSMMHLNQKGKWKMK